MNAQFQIHIFLPTVCVPIENISLEVVSKYHSQFRRGNFSRQTMTYMTQLQHSSAEPREGGRSRHTITQYLRIIIDMSINMNLNICKFTVHVLLKPGLENFEHSDKNVSLLQEGNWCNVPSIYLDNFKCISHINTFCPPSSN